jgi:hypothetical protein
MSAAPGSPATRATSVVADRLAIARGRRFVGRAHELELFRAALAAAEPPYVVLHVYGPGGIGKTTLVQQFACLGHDAGRAVVRLDMRDVESAPAIVCAALCHATGIDPCPARDLAARWPRDGVLIIDSYEPVASLEAWLRDVFIPRLPGRALVVIAGRTAPATAWSTDVEWAPLTRIVALRNLQPEESRTYLALRGVDAPRQLEILARTYGHPLALSLAADAVTREGGHSTFDFGHEPDLVRTLLQKFIEQPPSLQHRVALYACATVPFLTESLLAAALESDNTHALFEWLGTLSFIESGPQGLVPHDLAREVLYADSRWRSPDLRHALNARLLAHLYERFQKAHGLDQQRIWFEIIYVQRYNPGLRPYFAWTSFPTAYAEPAKPGDEPAILAMTARHEGAESAAIARYWLRRQPQAFLAFRDLAGDLLGYAAMLRLEGATDEDRRADPATARLCTFVENHAPARQGEEIANVRFWMARDDYQSNPATMNVLAANASLYWTSHPRLAWCFSAVHDSAHFETMFTGIHLWRTAEADFDVGGRRYGMFGHDWRVEPVAQWMMAKVERASQYELATPVEPAQPLLVLAEADFADAVRRALRDYGRRDELSRNPLLRTRLLFGRADPGALQALLADAARALNATPKDRKGYRAIWHTYIEPAATQEQVAEQLGVPFNTYRYQLARGTQAVTQWLWQREIGAA